MASQSLYLSIFITLSTLTLFSSAKDVTLVRVFGEETTLSRENEYGTPVIQGFDSLETTFQAVGYAHAEDRLWQIFLRFVSTNGRMAEFFGSDDENIENDKDAYRTMYTDEELMNQFSSSFSPDAQAAYTGFFLGIQERVREVNANPDSLLPYEFTQTGFSQVPEDVFTLSSLLTYSLTLLRSLCDGQFPDYQLEQLQLLRTLRTRMPAKQAQQIFDDLVTLHDTVVLDTMVAPPLNRPTTTTTPAHSRQTKYPYFRLFGPNERAVSLASKVLERNEKLKAFRKAKGILLQDGSWTVVIGPNRSTTKQTMLEGGPQDPMTFPTTFYEVFIDSGPIQAHFFTEPGCPQNQIYGTFGNWTAGRNRGYLPANDYLYEPADGVINFRTVSIKVKDEDPIPFTVYRSQYSGFVMLIDSNDALTLRSVFLGEELKGLGNLIDLFFVRSFDSLVDTISDISMQSQITHSHLIYSDNEGNIAAVMNGLWTELDPSIDRRLPQNFDLLGNIPEYSFADVVRTPPVDLNHPQGYYVGWNAPFNQDLPWFGRHFGGLWRSQWIIDLIENNEDKFSPNDFRRIIDRFAKAENLKLGGGGQYDFFPTLFEDYYFDVVEENPTPERLEALDILNGYAGDYVATAVSPDVEENYMLSAAWQYRVIYQVFNNITTGTMFEVPEPNPSVSLAVPTKNTPRRLPQLLSQIIHDPETTFFDWTDSVDLSEAILDGLDDALVALGDQPWGIGMRQQIDMDGVGGVLGTVGVVYANPIQSLNFFVEMSECGARTVRSSVPFGVSGFVGNGEDGPVYDPHAMDQFSLFSDFLYRPRFPLRFDATDECLPGNDYWLYYVVGGIVGAVVVGIVVALIFFFSQRNSYEDVGGE